MRTGRRRCSPGSWNNCFDQPDNSDLRSTNCGWCRFGGRWWHRWCLSINSITHYGTERNRREWNYPQHFIFSNKKMMETTYLLERSRRVKLSALGKPTCSLWSDEWNWITFPSNYRRCSVTGIGIIAAVAPIRELNASLVNFRWLTATNSDSFTNEAQF